MEIQDAEDQLRKDMDDSQLSVEEKRKLYFGYLTCHFIEGMWNVGLVYCFNARLNKTANFGESFTGRRHTRNPYIYEFTNFLEGRNFLVPSITLLIGLVHSVLIQTLWQKKLYYYPMSHIVGIAARILLVMLVANITGIISIGYSFFHFILGCAMAIGFAITVCLGVYFLKKLLRCRTSKHLIFTLALLLYCLSNTVFVYLMYMLFDDSST
jgi:hypothetical protein